MRTISHRKLRNSSAAIMDAVERGETFRVTRRGVEVAEIGPVTNRVFVPMDSVLEALHGLPAIDLKQLREQEDEFFGPDELEF